MDECQPSDREYYSPFFSIIIATYNSGKTIKNALDSIEAQSFENYELIIIDGLSNDETINIIERHPVKVKTLISEQDSGIYEAWNKGLKQAKGKWICFLGSDDVAERSMLSDYHELIQAKAEQETIDIISSKVRLVNLGKIVRTYGRPWQWKEFRHRMTIAHVGAMHNFKFFQKYGPFNENYKICGDYDILLRPRDRLNALFMNKITINMSIGGVSSTKTWHSLFEARQAKINNKSESEIFSNIYFIYSYLKIKLRKILWY